MKTLLSQLLRFDILVTRIVPSVLTAPSRQFYWRNTKAPRLLAASHPRPPAIMFRAGPAALGLETWEEATEAAEGIIWNTFIMRYDKKCCLGHTYVCFGFVNWKKYNYTTMLKKTVAKNALQRKESNLIWRPMINTGILSSPPGDLDGPRNWPIFIVPPLPITRYQTRSIQVESLSISQIRGCSNVLSWGGIIPPRNLLIIRDICMFHAQLHQKNSTCCISWPFIFP